MATKRNDVFGERYTWKKRDMVQILDEKRNKWFSGRIQNITIDDEGEWLNISYDNDLCMKQVQRWNRDIRPNTPLHLLQADKTIDNNYLDHLHHLRSINKSVKHLIKCWLKINIHKKIHSKHIENIICVFYYDYKYVKHIPEILMKQTIYNAYNIHYGNYIQNRLFFKILNDENIRNNSSLILRFINATQQCPPIFDRPLLDSASLVVPSHTTHILKEKENIFEHLILLEHSKITYTNNKSEKNKNTKNKDNKFKICVNGNIIMQSHAKIEFDASSVDLELPCINLEAKNGFYMNDYSKIKMITNSEFYTHTGLTTENKKEMISNFKNDKRDSMYTIKCSELKVHSDASFGRGGVVILDINEKIDDEIVKNVCMGCLCELVQL